MKISFIDAGLPRDSLVWEKWTARDGRFAFAGVGPVFLASLTGEDVDVEFVDEKVHGPQEEIETDVAAITFKTMNAKRAYGLADTLRSRGVKVILGGIHASLCPDEAALHADAVVVGEGEPVWPQVVADLRGGKLRKFYRHDGPPVPIDDSAPARMDLIDQHLYVSHPVQTARGCSLDCEFCPTRAMFGGVYRLRAPGTVVEEIAGMLEAERKPVFVVDDIFAAGEPDFIRDIADRLKGMDVSYAVICDVRMLTSEVLDHLRESGCTMVCLNIIASPTPEEKAVVHAIHERGMQVLAYIMFGFEYQTPDIFREVVDFVVDNDIRHVSLVILTPYKGTPMGERLAREGRILSFDWDLYDQAHVVFRPARMTPSQLEEGFEFALEEIGDRWSLDGMAESMGYPVAAEERRENDES